MKAVIAFQGNGLSDELIDEIAKSGLDIDYFLDIPNADIATRALDHVANPAFIATIAAHHSHADIAKLKRGVYRACIEHGVPLPSRCVIEARMLDVIVP